MLYTVLFFFLFSEGHAVTNMSLTNLVEKDRHYYRVKKPEHLKGNYVVAAQTDEKIIAITFDDGPIKATHKLTRVLKELECPATFFLIAKNVRYKHQRHYSSPLFEVGIHGFAHDNYGRWAFQHVDKEIKKAKAAMSKYNLKTKYFRPPYGAVSGNLSKSLKDNCLTGIMWSLDAEDWTPGQYGAGEAMVDDLSSRLEPGSIVLFHDTVNCNLLKKFITNAREQGYKIVSLSELLKRDRIIVRKVKKEIKPVWEGRSWTL